MTQPRPGRDPAAAGHAPGGVLRRVRRLVVRPGEGGARHTGPTPGRPAPRPAPPSSPLSLQAAARARAIDVAAESLRRAQARAFARRVLPATAALDLDGSGGRFTTDLGPAVVAVGTATPRLATGDGGAVLVVAGTSGSLPLGAGTVGGAWSDRVLADVPAAELPLALAEIHRVLRPGSPLDVRVADPRPAVAAPVATRATPPPGGDGPGTGDAGLAGEGGLLGALLTGAGFEVLAAQRLGSQVRVRAERLRTLPDTVAPGMRMLVVGLNPSLHAADAGVPFGRPGDRFWPAAVAAGACRHPHQPRDALVRHGMGLTDLVKRATAGAAELTPAEYRRGMQRLEWLVRWSRPRLVCFVGLSGWRAAVDRDARPGLQGQLLAGRPCYVMPSTIGAAAQSQVDQLAAHLRTAAELADRA